MFSLSSSRFFISSVAELYPLLCPHQSLIFCLVFIIRVNLGPRPRSNNIVFINIVYFHVYLLECLLLLLLLPRYQGLHPNSDSSPCLITDVFLNFKKIFLDIIYIIYHRIPHQSHILLLRLIKFFVRCHHPHDHLPRHWCHQQSLLFL